MAEASSPANEAAPTQYEPITDGQADIATTMDGDTMKVELEGRQPMQKIFLWMGSNEKSEGSKSKKTSSSQTTNKPYKPETDGPAECGLPELFPTKEEQIPQETAVEYLEVGLVIGDNPQWMKTTRKGLKKKETIPTLTRDDTALRVFIPITPFVAEQAKYYVGCRPTAGRCFPRVIDSELVFFYAEFWHGLPENVNKRERRDHVNARTKYHAATNKVAADRSSAAITFTELEKRTSSNPLAVTQSENVVNQLVLQLALYFETDNRDYLKGILKVMDDAGPDVTDGPYTADTGVVAFYDFEEDLSEEDANNVKRELKVSRLHAKAYTVYNINSAARVPSLTCRISTPSKFRQCIPSYETTAGATVFRTATSPFSCRFAIRACKRTSKRTSKTSRSSARCRRWLCTTNSSTLNRQPTRSQSPKGTTTAWSLPAFWASSSL